jgi:hypothetical protein
VVAGAALKAVVVVVLDTVEVVRQLDNIVAVVVSLVRSAAVGIACTLAVAVVDLDHSTT